MDEEDFVCLEWKDSELTEAYSTSFETVKADPNGENMVKNGENKEPEEKWVRINLRNNKPKWNVGDYCAALYYDSCFYEAKIMSLNKHFCTVEYLGYKEFKYVPLLHLRKSQGKKARRRQIKECREETFNGNSSDQESETVKHHHFYRKKKSPANQLENNTTVLEAACHQHYSISSSPSPVPCCVPPIPTANIPSPPAVPQFSAPMPPPLPHFPGQAMNSTFASAMSSWYLAGYYTGINSVQKDNHGCQCTCNRFN